MFAQAYEKARQFTRPLVISKLCVNGDIETTVASFVVVNRAGWILSAWHVQQEIERLSKSVQDVEAYDLAFQGIRADGSLGPKEKAKKLRKLAAPDAKAARKFSLWWSWDGVTLKDPKGLALPKADILVGRLDAFDPLWVTAYPEIKDPTKPLPAATSLCRLGFPFPLAKPAYDAQRGIFTFAAGSLVLPIFPIEGILTRFIEAGVHQRGYKLGYLETSSPGLKGQSGGPIVDVNGTVWAIQSQTQHLSLGFDPEVPGSKKGEKVHQFLNVGWGTHPETIVGLLTELGVAHSLSSY